MSADPFRERRDCYGLADVRHGTLAVVANQVRALAKRCAEAPEEVKALISASSVQVGRGVDMVGRSGDAFAA